METTYVEKVIKETLLAHNFEPIRVDNFKDGLRDLFLKGSFSLPEYADYVAKINNWTNAFRDYQAGVFQTHYAQ